ncbi:zinc ABC transporter substrate-binding protein [Verrucomicrobiales bacterium]|nr:zinc ABC transporter substrate-binding protein [Verrucomicrobiales bacterium]
MKAPLTFSLLLGLFLSSCTKSSRTESPDVIATTTMIADMVRVIAGDDVSVGALMRPGVDPHLYKASPADVSKLNQAKVIFYNGLLLEGKMEDLFKRLATDGKAVRAVSDTVPQEKRLAPEDSEGHPDPHIWGDARLWASTVDDVVAQLSATFPDHKEDFEGRGEGYKVDLETLHRWAEKRVVEIPEDRRKLVTSHDAFAYFGKAYGLEVVGVQGISTAADPSVADRTRMVDFIKANGITAIFVESSVNKALIEQIATDADVSVGGELFSDAMGEPGDVRTVNGDSYDVGTYIGMLKHNVNAIVEALR